MRCHRLIVAWLVLGALVFLGQRVGASATKPEQHELLQSTAEVNVMHLDFASFDGTKLGALFLEPRGEQCRSACPAIVLISSWVLDEHEYLIKARALAAKGYFVFSYSPRGFGRSQGMVALGSRDDVRDVSAILDWLEQNPRIDRDNIGTGGISYGAGISLLALANDSRLKTAVAMSGWGDLEESLYGKNTIRHFWIDLLSITGKIFGHLSPELDLQVERMTKRKDLDALRAWVRERSPLSYVESINQRRAPVFLANSYQDTLFHPGQLKEFYNQLEGPKFFYVDKGIHATSALPGLVGMKAPVWGFVERWFDHWLRHEGEWPYGNAAVRLWGPKGYEILARFPGTERASRPFKLRALNALFLEGQRDGDRDSALELRFKGGRDSGATSGIPLLSTIGDVFFKTPIRKSLRKIDQRYAAVFVSDYLSEELSIRGGPKISITVGRGSTPIQLIAYLYDVDERGIGTLISNGVLSDYQGRRDTQGFVIDLQVASYNIEAGRRLAIVIDTHDPLYKDLSRGEYDVNLALASDGAIDLEAPVLQ